MRICAMCRRAPRANDPLGRLQIGPDSPLVASLGVEPGSYQGVCAACVARFDPSRPDPTAGPLPPRFVQGTHGDPQAQLFNTLYCPLCRRWAREDEDGRFGEVRLVWDEYQEAVNDPLTGEPFEEGCYRACPECLERFRLAVYERWTATGVIDPGTPFFAFTHKNLG